MIQKRMLSLLIALMFILSLQTLVLADGIPFTFAVSVPDSERAKGIFAGQTVKATIELIFDESFSSLSQGIRTMQFGFRFDPSVMELVDGDTNMPLVFDEKGQAISGLLYHYDAIGMESQFAAILESNKKTVRCTYVSNVDGSADIFTSGAFIHFYLKARTDLSITDVSSTAFQITSPYIGYNAKDIECTILTEDIGLAVKPPFELNILGQPRQNETLLFSGSQFVPDKDEPLMLSVEKGEEGLLLEEKIDTNNVFFQKQLFLDEAIYTPGYYTVTLSYKGFLLNKSFTLQEKVPEPTPKPTVEPTPIPTPSDEPGSTDDPPKTDEPSNTPTHTEKPTSTPSTGLVARPSVTATPTPSPSEIPENPSVDTEKPIVYPSDIDGHWGADNIKYVYENGLMNGYADGTFLPDGKITRAEFAAVMARLLELPEAPEKATQFTDCVNHWAKGYIGALASSGIVSGVSDTLFAPGDNVTREQIAVILFRALGLAAGDALEKYADDSDISSWAYDGVYGVFTAGLMKGVTDGYFLPRNGATRAEVATILYRLHSFK